ncbi:CPBP family intramembrane glutamic endopeptidase [Actinomadura sp. 6N118]|uniref:CPBP family intramembrane glutamic endopeptidase n=1 Tax=Actinomadura sp. 6N118 TaxID=3375151 RepID=UPI003787660C
MSSLVKRHPLVTFFALALAISWCVLPFGAFLPFGPLVAALVVIAITDGKAGLRRLGGRLTRWRLGWQWYAMAVGVPLTVHLFAIGSNVGLGAAAPSLDQFSAWYSIFMVIGITMINPLNGPMGEEPGFRGFAQPSLQARRSPLQATAILAGVVALWHLPLFLIPEFELAPIELLATVAVTFWYAWLFNRTGGSVLITLLAHATEGGINTDDLWPDGTFATRETWLFVLGWVLVAAALLVFDRKTWTAAPNTAPGTAEPSPADEPSTQSAAHR